MKKIVLLMISIYLLFGFNSNKIEVEILSTTKHNAIIDKNVKNGMSGYVIHNNMIIATVISNGNKKITYYPFSKLKNKALATPSIFPQQGDKVVFGLYNFRGLIIAPNQKLYFQVKNKYPNITFLNSDIFASYFVGKPTKNNFKNFCADFNVGIIDFVLDKEYIVDCNSFNILKSYPINSEKYNKPFFSSYDKFNKSLFSSLPKNWINYYKNIIKGENGK